MDAVFLQLLCASGTFIYGRCKKGLTFLSKLVFKRVSVLDLGREPPHIKIEFLPPGVKVCYI